MLSLVVELCRFQRAALRLYFVSAPPFVPVLVDILLTPLDRNTSDLRSSRQIFIFQVASHCREGLHHQGSRTSILLVQESAKILGADIDDLIERILVFKNIHPLGQSLHHVLPELLRLSFSEFRYWVRELVLPYSSAYAGQSSPRSRHGGDCKTRGWWVCR